MSAVSAVAALIALAGALPLAAVGRRRSRASEEILEEVARRRSGRMERSGRGRRLRVERDGALVSVRMQMGLAGTFVSWSAWLPPPGTIAFWVETRRQGDDGRVAVHADFPGLLERVWRPEDAATMTAWPRGSRLSGAVRRVKLHVCVSHPDVALVEAGLDLLLAVAAADPYGLQALRTLPDARDLRAPAGELPGVVVTGPVPVHIGPAAEGSRVFTRARAELRLTSASGATQVVAGRADPAGCAALPEAARRHLPLLGTAAVEWGARGAAIRWPKIEEDPRRLGAAVAFLRALAAAPSLGAFR